MLNFKKYFNMKIISLIVVMVFLFNNITYGDSIFLRKPLDFQKPNMNAPKNVRYFTAYKELRYKDDDFSKRPGTEVDLIQYFESKGIKITDKGGLKKLPLDKLKAIASIVSILPKEHLPPEIIFKSYNIFRPAGSVPKDGNDKGKVILYCGHIANNTVENTFLHETGHTLKKEIQEQISFYPSRPMVFLLNYLITGSIFFYLTSSLDETLWMGRLFQLGVIVPTIMLLLIVLYWFAQDERFARYYAKYVLQGDKIRKGAIYQSMKDRVFNGIEYAYDLNGKLVMLSDTIAESVGLNEKYNERIYGRLNRELFSNI